MRIGRTFVAYFVEVEESTGWNALFAEGLETVEGGGGEEPC